MSPHAPVDPLSPANLAAAPLFARLTLFRMALVFLKIGAIGFGGGMAVIALIERDCVQKYRCVESEEFLHGVGLGQILGPFAVNASVFIGYRMYGIVGGLTAAAAFLFPSVALVTGLSWLYFKFHTIPTLQNALTGLGPIVIALIVSAAITMGRKSLRSWPMWVLAALGCLGSVLRVNPVWVLGMSGALGLMMKLGGSGKEPTARRDASSPGMAGVLGPFSLSAKTGSELVSVVGTASSITLSSLGWTFLKIGFVFFGGGFVLIPILHQQLVTNLHWLSPGEFVDGVAISQLTPGPIAVLATFTGYRVGGVAGALVATFALFAPALALMLIICRFYDRVRSERRVKDFLAGIVPAVVGMIIAAALLLAPDNLHLRHPVSLILAALSLIALVRWKWHPAILIGLGAIAGLAVPGWLS